MGKLYFYKDNENLVNPLCSKVKLVFYLTQALSMCIPWSLWPCLFLTAWVLLAAEYISQHVNCSSYFDIYGNAQDSAILARFVIANKTPICCNLILKKLNLLRSKIGTAIWLKIMSEGVCWQVQFNCAIYQCILSLSIGSTWRSRCISVACIINVLWL